MNRPDAVDVATASGSAVILEIFIYFRVQAGDEAATRLRVAEFQSALVGRFSGLCARLLRRHADADAGQSALLTLMEAYSFDAAASASLCSNGLAELLAAIGRAAAPIGPLIQGERHVEVFEPCA